MLTSGRHSARRSVPAVESDDDDVYSYYIRWRVMMIDKNSDDDEQ